MLKSDVPARIIDGYSRILPELRGNNGPRDQEGSAAFSRPLPEFNGKKSAAAGAREEVRDGINRVNPVPVRMEVLGEVEFPASDRPALYGEIVQRVGGVREHVDPDRGCLLPGAAGKSRYAVPCKKTVQAGDDSPLEITHLPSVGRMNTKPCRFP